MTSMLMRRARVCVLCFKQHNASYYRDTSRCHNDGRTTMVAQRWSHNDGRYHRQLTMTARERWSLSQEAPESLRVENNDDRVVITG